MKTLEIITAYNLLREQCEESYKRLKEAERISRSDVECISKDEYRDVIDEHGRIYAAFESFKNHDWK